MGLFRRNGRMTGIDLGSGLVKAAVVDHGGDTPRLLRLASCPVPPDAILEGEILDDSAVAAAIREVVSGLGGRTGSVAVAVGGREVIVRKVSVDRVPPADIPEVISWEAESVVPFEMRDVRLGYQLLEDDGGARIDALLVAARKELVDARVRLLESAGVHAAIVDVDAFALFNALEFNYPHATNGVVALVNIGHETTTIVVCQDGLPLGARDMSFGSRQIRRELRHFEAAPGAEADRLPGGDSRYSPELNRLMEERARDLGMAVGKAVAAATEGDRGSFPDVVFLSGGAASMAGLRPSLARSLGVRVEIVTPFQRLEAAPEALADMPDHDLASLWMLPVGLALRSPLER